MRIFIEEKRQVKEVALQKGELAFGEGITLVSFAVDVDMGMENWGEITWGLVRSHTNCPTEIYGTIHVTLLPTCNYAKELVAEIKRNRHTQSVSSRNDPAQTAKKLLDAM